jgi:hypothetical protein
MKPRPDDGGRLITVPGGRYGFGDYRVPASKFCATCGEPYRPVTNRQRYCSPDCKRYRDTFTRRLFRQAARASRPLPYTRESLYVYQLDARVLRGDVDTAPPERKRPVFVPPKRCAHVVNGAGPYPETCAYCAARMRPDPLPRYYTPVSYTMSD